MCGLSGIISIFARHFEVPEIHMRNCVSIFEASRHGLSMANDVRLLVRVWGGME